jgi:type IV pilus assembly protein PilX
MNYICIAYLRAPSGSRLRPRGQRGTVLFVALIVLVAMMLASIVLVRAVDTTNLIAGNLTFKQSTVQAGDYGIEAAVAALPQIVATIVDSDTQAPDYWYYATMRRTDPHGVPTTAPAGAAGAPTPINWNDVPVAETIGGNEVRIVIERLCTGEAPITDIPSHCVFEGHSAGGSKAIGRPVFATSESVFYRVTTHVTGPRNTVSLVQAVVSR